MADLEQDEYLTIAEIAAELKLSPETIRQWIVRGELEGTRAGKSWRILRSDLRRMLGGQRPAAGANPMSYDDDVGGVVR
jgi:excisionase family DNA binding protein